MAHIRSGGRRMGDSSHSFEAYYRRATSPSARLRRPPVGRGRGRNEEHPSAQCRRVLFQRGVGEKTFPHPSG